MDAACRRCFPGEYTSEPSAGWLGGQCAVCDGCVLFTLSGIVLANEQVPGDCDDEGTLFSLSNSNITCASLRLYSSRADTVPSARTEDELRRYLSSLFSLPSNSTGIDAILSAYPEDPTLGSPFETGSENAITPQFKRISAILGDLNFQAPRRFFLSERFGNITTFAFRM